MPRAARMVDDPVFGRLMRKISWWSGEAGWPHERGRVGVMIFRSPAAPTEADRRAFTEVRANYSILLPRISAALFSLWESAPRDGRDAGSSPGSPAELLSLLRLECICIEASAMVQLLYEGKIGLFTVRIDGGNVQPHAFE
jgi:hypothetical protein